MYIADGHHRSAAAVKKVEGDVSTQSSKTSSGLRTPSHSRYSNVHYKHRITIAGIKTFFFSVDLFWRLYFPTTNCASSLKTAASQHSDHSLPSSSSVASKRTSQPNASPAAAIPLPAPSMRYLCTWTIDGIVCDPNQDVLNPIPRILSNYLIQRYSIGVSFNPC